MDRTIAIASGKGGVGKTSLAVSLATAFAGLGERTWLIDADLGLGNVDVLCGATPRWSIADVVDGRARLTDVAHPVASNLAIVPGGSGLASMADLGEMQRERLLTELAAAESTLDRLLIDCGAGIGRSVLGFCAAAHRVLVVVTPDPASMVDAYGFIKSLHRVSPAQRIDLLVNQCEGPLEATSLHGRIDGVARTHLGREIGLSGWIPRDSAVQVSARTRRPFVSAAPQAPASVAVADLARTLARTDQPAQPEPEPMGFAKRFAAWLSGS
ncbi:MAG: MinD/ParA family protein [Phycisphaerales bacterium]